MLSSTFFLFYRIGANCEIYKTVRFNCYTRRSVYRFGSDRGRNSAIQWRCSEGSFTGNRRIVFLRSPRESMVCNFPNLKLSIFILIKKCVVFWWLSYWGLKFWTMPMCDNIMCYCYLQQCGFFCFKFHQVVKFDVLIMCFLIDIYEAHTRTRLENRSGWL